jgi:photosystem II stability/assembly factor-like uncharacterized protein
MIGGFMKRLFVSLSLLVFTISITTAQQDYWQQTNGPYGSSIFSLAKNKFGDLLAITSGYNLYHSTNEGENWAKINTNNTIVSILGLHSNGYLFASGGDKGILRSTDNGINWDTVFTKCMFPTSLVTTSQGDIFISGWYNGVFRSTDNGYNWMQVNTGLTDTTVLSLTTDSTGYIFAGTRYHGVFRTSYDEGYWTKVNNGLNDVYVSQIATDYMGNIFAGVEGENGGIYKSTNNGESWINIYSCTGYFDVTSILFKSDSLIFIGTSQGILRSTDSGATWTEANYGLRNTQVTQMIISTIGNIFAGTNGGGVYRSQNNGNEWMKSNNGLDYSSIHTIAKMANGDIYAGSSGNGLFSSNDFGASWTQVGLMNDVSSLVVNSNGDIFLVTGSLEDNNLYISTDNGSNWLGKNISGTTQECLESIAIDSNGTIYIGTGGCNPDSVSVFRSTDNGNNWLRSKNGLQKSSIQSIEVGPQGYIFAGTSKGVFRSTNNGESWVKFNKGLLDTNVSSIAINSDGNVFAGIRNGGIYRLIDNFIGWERMQMGFTDVLCIEIYKDGSIFVGTYMWGGVFKSSDNGNTWVQLNAGLAGDVVSDIGLGTEGYIYAGTRDGVFRSVQPLTNIKHQLEGINYYKVSQNYPNPFNPNTMIKYELPVESSVKLKIFDVLGREIAVLIDGIQAPGFKSANWDSKDSFGRSVGSGIYFYKLEAISLSEHQKVFTQIRKMLLIK